MIRKKRKFSTTFENEFSMASHDFPTEESRDFDLSPISDIDHYNGELLNFGREVSERTVPTLRAKLLPFSHKKSKKQRQNYAHQSSSLSPSKGILKKPTIFLSVFQQSDSEMASSERYHQRAAASYNIKNEPDSLLANRTTSKKQLLIPGKIVTFSLKD